MLLTKAIENFIFHCQFEKNLSTKTLQAYQIDMAQFISFGDFKHFKIEEFNKHLIKQYIQSLYKEEFKAKTIKRKLAVLKAFFTYLESY